MSGAPVKRMRVMYVKRYIIVPITSEAIRFMGNVRSSSRESVLAAMKETVLIFYLS